MEVTTLIRGARQAAGMTQLEDVYKRQRMGEGDRYDTLCVTPAPMNDRGDLSDQRDRTRALARGGGAAEVNTHAAVHVRTQMFVQQRRYV